MNLHDTAFELLTQLNPSADQNELEDAVRFGFGLSSSPQQFINQLTEQIYEKV